MQSIKKYNPEWSNNCTYFLTDSTFLHYPYFKTDDQKQIVYNQFKKIQQKLDVPITDYSIATNHYHVKFYIKQASVISKVLQSLRGGISYEYRKKFDMSHKNMWQTRKILLVESEKMDWMVTGYICGNLLKHKEVSTFEDLKQNRFSSYWYQLEKHGESMMQEIIRRVINVDEDQSGEINKKQLMNLKL